MSEQPFVHLHVHSEFSLLDGLSRIKDLVQRAKTLNQPAIALTDHGAMYGAIPFYRTCKREGIKPIIGIETYLAARTMHDRDPQLDKNRAHMLLLAENQTGYMNLLKIASAAQLDGFYYKPRIDRAFMAAHSDGLIATTGCMAAEIPRAINQGNMRAAHRLMGEYVDIFGPDRLFVELQQHNIPELTQINKKLVEMAGRYDLRFLATNDVHYTRPEDADPHDVLLCIQTGTTVQTENRMRFSDKGYYLKAHSEMAELFGEIPGALENSLLIAEMCNINLENNGYHLPHFPVPEEHTPASYLRELCAAGLVWRYGEQRAHTDQALQARLEHELKLIHEMGFDTYFLIVWDLCEWAARSDQWWAAHQDPFPYSSYGEWKRNDIWWNVRGSGAGSVVAYTLGITSIDPLANGLIFERFLNPGRVSMPDIDLDYPDDVRGQMVEYTVRRYGREKVAQIITFGTLGARAAIRDVGRAFDMPLEDVDAIARLVPAIPGKPAKIEHVLDQEHEFYSADLVQKYRQEEEVRELLDTAQKLEGVSRHASSHAAGVIVSDRPLVDYLPLNRPTSGETGLGGVDRVTQWPMEVVESIGLLKIDFLGLSTLTVMRLAARLIEERHGVRYTMDNIPYDEEHVGPDPEKDPRALFDMLGRGQVAGVFQVEGAGMRRLMLEMKPRRFDHIIAAISLYRPGPMDNIPEYIRRMHAAIYEGEDIVQYHAPELKPILQDTYGILVYQEQIIRIAADLAGYEPGDADMIRKAVSKKKKDLMDQHRKKFTKGAMARGFSRDVCDNIWGDIEFFARYGFNKSHASDYAKVTCQTAFLKAHYPVEYMTALLSVERHNTDKIRRYFAEAKSLNIAIAPPDINHSRIDFAIEDSAEGSTIRFGLGAIKNAGEGAIQLILDEREANGPFSSLQDLCERVDLRRVGKRAVEYMIKARAILEWGTTAQLLDSLERIISYSSREHEAAASGQMSLFGGAMAAKTGAKAGVQVALLRPEAALKEVAHKQLLEWEKDALGVHVSEHPLERPLALLQDQVSAGIQEIDAGWNGKQVRLAGMLAQLRTLKTRKGDPMAFGALEDLDDKIELVFFPRTWAEVREKAIIDQIMLVSGKVQAGDQRLSLIVDKVQIKFNHHRPAGDQPPWDTPGPEPATSPPVLRETAATARYTPPPPPEFEDEWTTAGAANGAATQRTNGVKQKMNESRLDSSTAVPDLQMVTVAIDPAGDWQQTIRRAVNLAGEHQGTARLALTLNGRALAMELPDRPVAFTPQFKAALEALPGVVSVSAG